MLMHYLNNAIKDIENLIDLTHKDIEDIKIAQHSNVFERAKIKNDLFHYDFSDGIITNKAGTGHGVKSKHCLVLIFYKKLPQFPNKNS